jgi:hypothetical protein
MKYFVSSSQEISKKILVSFVINRVHVIYFHLFHMTMRPDETFMRGRNKVSFFKLLPFCVVEMFYNF